MGSSSNAVAPYRLQLCPFKLPTNEGCCCHECWLRCLLFMGGTFGLQQTLVDRTRGLAWLRCQFAFQDGRTGMIDTQCSSPIVGDRVKAHQLTVGCFVQGIVTQQALSSDYGGIVIALLFLQLNQPFQCLEEHLVQAISFGEYPFIVTTG